MGNVQGIRCQQQVQRMATTLIKEIVQIRKQGQLTLTQEVKSEEGQEYFQKMSVM